MPPQHRNRHRDERAVRAKAVRPPCNDPQLVVDALHGGSPPRLQPLAPNGTVHPKPTPGPHHGPHPAPARRCDRPGRPPSRPGRKAHICCLSGLSGQGSAHPLLWWTGRRMITREDVDDLRTEIAAWHRSADEQMQEQRAYMAQHGYIVRHD